MLQLPVYGLASLVMTWKCGWGSFVLVETTEYVERALRHVQQGVPISLTGQLNRPVSLEGPTPSKSVFSQIDPCKPLPSNRLWSADTISIYDHFSLEIYLIVNVMLYPPHRAKAKCVYIIV